MRRQIAPGPRRGPVRGSSGLCWQPYACSLRVADALPGNLPKGWGLAVAACDIDGDLLPELYIANDFGPDRLLWNRSTPNHMRFELVAVVPSAWARFVQGHGSRFRRSQWGRHSRHIRKQHHGAAGRAGRPACLSQYGSVRAQRAGGTAPYSEAAESMGRKHKRWPTAGLFIAHRV